MHSQVNGGNTSFYNWFDEKIGLENSGLYNGTVYTDNYTIINEKHPFLESSELLLGSVTYTGQTYYDQKIKYDLFKDVLLITPKNKTSALLIVLESTRTDGFSIDGRPFLRIDKTIEGSSQMLGFCEIISKNRASMLVKKYAKTKRERRETNAIYQEFEQNVHYFARKANAYYAVDSKGEWIAAFPQHKKIIKGFFQEYHSLKRTDYDGFMKSLFEHLFSYQRLQNTSN